MSKKYEEKYFTKQFSAVGDFSLADLKRNKNWFLTQLLFFQRHFKIDFSSAQDILEVGCAIGGISHIFSERHKNAYATDISSYAIRRAKKLSPDIKFIVSDIQKDIPIKKKFDFIFAFEVLEHLEDPKRGLKNIKKKLKRNGVLIATTPYPFRKYLSIETHVNVLKPVEWIKNFKNVGFKRITYAPVTFVPYLYKISPLLGIILPINTNLPFINSTVFYVAQ